MSGVAPLEIRTLDQVVRFDGAFAREAKRLFGPFARYLLVDAVHRVKQERRWFAMVWIGVDPLSKYCSDCMAKVGEPCREPDHEQYARTDLRDRYEQWATLPTRPRNEPHEYRAGKAVAPPGTKAFDPSLLLRVMRDWPAPDPSDPHEDILAMVLDAAEVAALEHEAQVVMVSGLVQGR